MLETSKVFVHDKKVIQLLNSRFNDFIKRNCEVYTKLCNFPALDMYDCDEGSIRGLVRTLKVDREKLYAFTGKNRKPQMELAKKFSIDYYPSPAGGCLLTIQTFADRLRINLEIKKLSKNDLELLKCGRHFLTEKQVKIIVGRYESDNYKILDSMDDDYCIVELVEDTGPVAVLCESEPDIEDILHTGSVVARYSKLRDKEKVQIKYYKKNRKINLAQVKPKGYQELDWKLI